MVSHLNVGLQKNVGLTQIQTDNLQMMKLLNSLLSYDCKRGLEYDPYLANNDSTSSFLNSGPPPKKKVQVALKNHKALYH
jgi:hypothetical protein